MPVCYIDVVNLSCALSDAMPSSKTSIPWKSEFNYTFLVRKPIGSNIWFQRKHHYVTDCQWAIKVSLILSHIFSKWTQRSDQVLWRHSNIHGFPILMNQYHLELFLEKTLCHQLMHRNGIRPVVFITASRSKSTRIKLWWIQAWNLIPIFHHLAC